MSKWINKKGYVEILTMIAIGTIILIIFTVFFLIYIQIDFNIVNVKKDLFYIVQNAYLSLDNDELGYGYYYINEEELKHKVKDILSKNFPKFNIVIKELKYLNGYVDIKLNVSMEPCILKSTLGNIECEISDKIKLKLLEATN